MVGWVRIPLANVYCMTQLLLRVEKLFITYSRVTVPASDVQNSTAIVS